MNETVKVYRITIDDKSCYIDTLADTITELGTLLAESGDKITVQMCEMLQEDYQKIPEDFSGW